MKERIKKEICCKNCKSLYWSKSMSSIFCSPECRKEFKVKDGKEIGKDYVICQICQRATSNVTGSHLKNHSGWDSKKYKESFPGFQNIAENVREKCRIGSIKAGEKMRDPYYKKMFSDKMKGNKNPMHRSKTTDSQRKSISPFSPDFYIRKNPDLTYEEAVILASEKKKSVRVVSWVKKEYWMSKGFSEEESERIVSEKQSTFSLDKCIEKYGKEEGKKRWIERQEKWSKNYKKSNYSKKSQELFSSLYPLVSSIYNDIYFATLNEDKQIIDNGKNNEYRLKLENRLILPDFLVLDCKKIIEFDGIYWHNYDRRNKPENKKREEEKDEEIIRNGYSILRISELEWEKNPKETIVKCLKFLL